MNKKNWILLGVLAVLALAVYAYKLIDKKIVDERTRVGNFASVIDVTKLDRISWEAGAKKMVLNRENKSWRIETDGQFYVQPDLMDQVLGGLAQLASSSLAIVSLQPDNKVLFGLDGEAKLIKLSADGREILQFQLGRSDGVRSYLSQVGDDKSYASLADLSAWQVEDWFDKKIFDNNSELWTSLTVDNKIKPKESWSVKKVNQEWLAASGEKLAIEKLKPVLNAMSQLQASALPKQSLVGTGLDKPSLVIKVASDNLSNAMLVGRAEGNNYYVKNAASENIYLVDKGVIALFDQSLRDFVK
jgi:hypothetical protein